MKLTLLMTGQHTRRLETQENSSVQEILADVVKTKETFEDLYNMTKHPNCGKRRCG
jgi:hypothetical protein